MSTPLDNARKNTVERLARKFVNDNPEIKAIEEQKEIFNENSRNKVVVGNAPTLPVTNSTGVEVPTNLDNINDVPTIAPRTYGDYNGNALPIIGDALHTVGKGAIDLATTVGTGYQLIGKTLTGKEVTGNELDNNLTSVHDTLGLDTAYYRDMYSSDYKEYLAKQAAIGNSGNSQFTNYKDQLKLYRDNLGYAGLDATKTALQSGIEMLIGTKALQGVRGLTTSARVFGSSAIPEIGHYIGQEKAEGNKVDGNTITNALGSAAVVGGTELLGGKLFGHGNLENLTDALMQGTRVRGSAVKNMGTDMFLEGGLQEPIQNAAGTALHNYENNRDLSEGQGQGLAQSQVLGTASAGIMSTPVNIGVAVRNGTDAGKALVGKANSAIRQKAAETSTEGVGNVANLTSGKYDPVRAISDNISVLNSDTITMDDVTTANNNVVQIRANALAHIHELQEKIESAESEEETTKYINELSDFNTNYWKPLETQNKLAKQAFKNIAGKLEQDSTESNETSDEFVQNAADNFVNLLRAPVGTYVDPEVAAQTNDAAQRARAPIPNSSQGVNLTPHGLPNTLKDSDVRSLGFTHEIKQGAIKGNVQGDTVAFAKLVDQDGLGGFIKRFSAFNDGSGVHASGKQSHGTGYKFDLSLKQDTPQAYAAARKRMIELANAAGYEVVVTAEHPQGAKQGLEGFAWYKNSTGSHLDVRVVGRTNGNSQGGTLSTGRPAVSGVKSLVAVTVAKESAGGDYNIANYDKGGVAKGVRVTEFTLERLMSNADGLNAAGKYQVITPTLRSAVKELGLNPKLKFTPEVQEQIAQWLYFKKNPTLASYIKGGNVSVEDALDDLSTEWQAIGNRNGLISIGSTKGRRAHVQPVEVIPSLQAARQAYAQAKAQGMSDSQAEVYAINNGTTLSGGTGSSGQTSNTDYQQEIVKQNRRISDLEDELAKATDNNNQEQIDSLTAQIDELKQQMAAQLEQAQGQEQASTEQVESTSPEAQAESVQAKKELTPEVVEQQEIVAQKAIQRARANNLTAQHVDTLEQSGAITQTQAQELRVMLDNQRILTAANTANDVNNEVINGRKRDRSIDSMVGLSNYADVLDTAIDTGDTKTLGKFMSYLERFAANRSNKSTAINEALLQNPSNDNPIYVVPDKSGNWRVESGLVKGNQELFKAGAFQVWQNNNTNNAVAEESKLTNDLLNNYQQIIALRQQNGLLSDFTQQATQPTHNTQVKPSKFADDPLLVNTKGTEAIELTEFEQGKVKEHQATYDKQLSDWSLDDFSNVGVTISDAQDSTGSREVSDSDLAIVKDTITQGIKEGKPSLDIINSVQAALAKQGKTIKLGQLSNLETYIKYQQSLNKGSTGSSATLDETKAGNKNKDGKLHQPKKGSRVRIDGTNVVYQNQADSVDYKPETNNEILVGREYEFSTKTNTKSGKPSLKPTANSGLAIFTKDGKLATGESAKGKFFDLSRINEPGALGNPFTSLSSAQTITDENGKQVPNSWYVKNRQAEIVAYINLLKHFATSTKDDRMAFLEVLPQLTGKLLVTDFYHQEEALFVDYLVKGLDKVTRTSRKNDSRQDRIDANEAAREWVERITYELITDDKGNRKIEFSQDNTTPLEELIANRKSGQKPKKPIIDETSDEIIEVDESKVTDNEVEVEEISTDDDTTVSTGVFDLGEDDTADTKDALEDAPEVMLSRAEKAAQANQQEDESLEEALERTNTEFNLDKPQVTHKIIDKLMLANALAGFGNQDEETNNYFKEMILALTNYLDDPKVVINDKAVIPTFNGETNTVEVKLSENLLRDIASALIRQSTLDIADEVNNYSIKDYRELSEDAKYQPGILTKDEINYAKHIANINNKLQTVKEKIAASLETKVVDEGTARLLSIMINGQLGSILSIGLTNGKVREFLSSVTYKPNKKATRTSLFKYLLNALQEFIGVKPKYENVLETLLSIQGDIAEVKLLKSDFNSTEDAKLSAFNITEEELASELNKPLDKRNRLLSSFTQSGKTTLSTVKDVANKLLQDPSKGVHFILGEPMTPEQRTQLDDFQEFKNSFVRYLKSSFAVQNKASDMKAYLYDSNGELDDNLVTALALSAYSWFIANGNKELNTFDDVKKLLAMDKDSDAILPARIYRDYKYMGNLSMFVASDLGKTAVAALGIDETADAKRFSKAELEMSLGNWVLSALQNTGMVTLLPMDREQHIKNMKAVGGKIPENVTNSNASELLFVTLKPGEEYSRHARIQEIIDSSKGARGFLSNLFKTDIGLRSPKYKQPTKVKSKIKKSKSIVSNLQATFINKMQSESIEIDVRTLDAVNTLLSNNGSWFRQLIGAEVTQSELNKMHINDRDSAEAAAEGLKRELETGLGFIAGLKRTGNTLQKFWDSIYVARNTRMHFNSNELNMQTSLIHRMLGSYSNFKTTLSMDGITLDNLAEKALDTEGKPTKLGLFLSALAMNLEGTDSFIKAHTDVDLQAYTKDKVPSSIFMPAFAEWIAQDTIQRAVKAMQNVLNNKVGTNDLDAIKSFVDEGDMGIQSFRALVELANMMSAIENGTELTTSIGLGSDGINNGIALGSIYNGVANIRTMLQTGFIPKDSEFKNYLETRLDRSIGDYYEAYAEVLSETMGNLLNDAVFFADLQKKNIGEESINAIQEIQPAFNVVKFPKPARKLAKAIIIPFGYSAGIARLVQVAQETFIGDIQKQLTDLANEPNATKQTQLKNNLRILLADETFELPSNPKDLLEFWFTPKQVNKLASTYEVIVGEAIDKSLNTFAGDFKAARERNIEMHEHTYQMYERVYSIIVNKALKELANQLDKTPEEIAKRGFTNKEWDALVQPELDKVMPSLYTAFNTTANDIEIDDTIDPINDALSGIEVFKRGRKLVANKVKSFTRLATGDNKLESIQNTLPAMEEILEKIGVFVNSAQIQGTDGRISAAASSMLGSDGIVNLNIHDQNDGGLDSYVQMVLTQNKATFDVLATNHLQLNSLETFMTMLDKYMNTLSELGLNADDIVSELIAILGKHVGEESAYSLPSEYLEALFTLVRNTELTKLSTLQNLKAIQQYAGETGEYVVTDNDVKLAKDQEAIISERMTKLESSLSKYLSLEETISTISPSQQVNQEIGSNKSKAVEGIHWAKNTTKPNYEVSTKGDKRFSALVAKLSDGRTIEEAYQLDIKGYRSKLTGELKSDSWKLGKGKPSLNGQTYEEQYLQYRDLWIQYLNVNPELAEEITAIVESDKVLTDMFANSKISQARALAEIVKDGLFETDHNSNIVTIKLSPENEKIHNANVEKLSPILNKTISVSAFKKYLTDLTSHTDNENSILSMLDTYMKLLSNAAIDTYINIVEDESKFASEEIRQKVSGKNPGFASTDINGNTIHINLKVIKELGFDLKEILFHELNHQVTLLAVTRLIAKENRNEKEQAIYNDLVNIGTTLKGFVDVNNDLLTEHELSRFNYMFMSPAEFITVPVTERSIQDLLALIPVNYTGRVHPLFNQMLNDTVFKPQATNMLEAMAMLSYELMNMNDIGYKKHVIKTATENSTKPTKGNTDELLIANRDDIPRIQREATETGEGSESTESNDDPTDTGSQDTDGTSQSDGTDGTTNAAQLGEINNPHSWIADLINKVVKGNAYNPGQIGLMEYIFRRIKESGLTIDMTIVDEDTMRSLANGQRELGIYLSGKIYLLDSHVNSGNDFAVAATVLHELLHQLTVDGIESTDPTVVRARNELERMFKHLKGKVTTTNNAHLDSIIDIVFNEPDVAELITYGITDPTFTQWMARNLADFNKNKSGLSNPINELKRFLKVVSVYFKWDKHNDVLTPKPIKSLLKKDEENFEHFVRVVDNLTIAISKSSTNEVSTTAPKANTIAATQLSNNGSSTAHDNHLDKVNDVIQAFKDSLPEREVAVNASSKNKTNDSLMNLLGLTDKESYTYESVKAVVETFLKTQGNNKTVRELLAIYKELQSGQITKENFVSNWGTATAQERNYAKSVYDQLFGANKSNQKQDHLVKFISLALTSEKFRKAISIKRNRIKTTDTNGIFGTLMGLFERIVNVFTNMVSNLSGKNVSEQVDTLFTKLAEIDARSRSNKLSGFELIWNAKGVITDASNKFARSTINKAIGSLPKDPRTFLGKIGTVVNKGVNEDLSKVVTQYLEMYSTYIQKTAVGRGKARYGEIRNLISDFGSNTQIKKVHDRLVMVTQSIGRERQKIKDNTREGLLTKFFNNGANLTKEIREALTSMVLRTDLGSLLDYTNMHTVMSYFNETTRNNTIAALEKKIMGIPHGNHMIMQSKDLAKYMITDGGSDTLVKSAQGIAINQGTVYESDFKNMEESLYEDTNTLTSLYALKYANDRHGYVFNSLIADEKEGIKALITLHSDIVKISKEDFNNNPYNYIKGYLPEITNPNRSLTWILEDQLEEYLAQGWERINEDLLPRDASDRSDNRILMYHKHIDYQDRVSGDLDLKDTHSKGYAVYTAADDYLDIMRVAKDKLARQQDREANQDPIAYNPFDNRSSFIPNFGADGAIINYHYEMEGFLRDQYLERNNDALELISVLNAKVQIKPKLQESQRNVARALYADYQRNYALNPLAFVTMTPDSIDPKVVEDYALMPHVFREEAIKLFGKDMPIVVRASVYNTVFGFRTYSIGKMFDKVVNERNALEKILVRVFSSIPIYDANKKYKVSLANAKGKSIAVMLEDIIKALTGFSKDVIVNRGYKVVLGNMISNILLLGIHGIDPITIAKDFTFAWQEGKRYNQAESEKIKLEVRLQIETNPSEKARIRQAIVEKKAYMDRSKIKRYMEIGLMSTIVEDVSTLSDDLGYKTRYEEFVAPVTNHIPKAVKDTFGFLIMSPGTTMHNFISDANQFTDFAAKYTLAKHLQSKGTSFDEAIAVAQENFLNFDIPQGQGMDYMNKVGLFMFTKFFIRFQRVLTKLMLEKPAQLIAHQMMLDGLFDMPSVMQPYLLYNIGNPFDLGAVGMIGAADDMMLPSLFI